LLSLSLAAAAAAAPDAPIVWQSLGLKPYLFEIGSFQLRWYSLAYLAGILVGYWQMSRMIKAPGAPLAQRHADDLFFYCTLGIILGGRLGYAIAYGPELFTSLDIFKLWEGGMSFHGGLVGVLVAMGWVCWRGGLNFVRVADYVAVCVPAGMLFGRLANFINGELWGRVAESPVAWAMVFPGTAGPYPRHPSQLYEALFEGLLLLLVMLYLFWRTRARWRTGLLVGVFATGMGVARFVIEFYREPDAHLLEFAQSSGLTRGQWLTIPLILVGMFFLVRGLLKPELNSGTPTPA
jgi:phosphatidylglycerol---prolipoprotein diacylglyceryl transferase